RKGSTTSFPSLWGAVFLELLSYLVETLDALNVISKSGVLKVSDRLIPTKLLGSKKGPIEVCLVGNSPLSLQILFSLFDFCELLFFLGLFLLVLHPHVGFQKALCLFGKKVHLVCGF